MRSFKIFSFVALLAAGVLLTTAFINVRLLKKVKSNGNGFAVIELFTSEGCSSCPPADELVAKIEKESKDKPVYILAYHVDYWDRLGWKDSFSNADYSKRQYSYASLLHLQSVYTPQIVVNGQKEILGSDENTLRNTIKSDLQKTAAAQLTLTITEASHTRAVLKYTGESADKNTTLLLAVLEKNAQTKVERGENAGHTLSHVQIVRKLQSVSLNGDSGFVNVPLPDGFNAHSWEIIGFLQNTRSGAITAARRVEFSSPLAEAK